jgi:hypothetical protein
MLPSREHRVRQSPQWTRLGYGLSLNPVLSTLRGSKRPFKRDLTNINACSQVLAAGEWLHLRALSLTKMTLSGQCQYLCQRGHAPFAALLHSALKSQPLPRLCYSQTAVAGDSEY